MIIKIDDLGTIINGVSGEVWDNEKLANEIKKRTTYLLKKGIDKILPLYENFFFDRREEVSRDLRVISKPVFHFFNE